MSEAAKQGELQHLRALLRQFAAERDWEQFHTPENLAAALSVEAAELLEPFQWLHNGEASELGIDKLKDVRFEMADVLAYLIQLADKLDVDLYQALLEKIERNRAKYPAATARGHARKPPDLP